MCFVLLRPIFCEKWKIAPPHTKRAPLRRLNLRNLGEKSLWILAKTFFFFFGNHLNLGGKNVWISDFGRKITLNFGEDFFFFFGDHLNLGGKNVWISDFGRKITLNFGEDLFFYFFFGDHLNLGGKNVWISDFGRKITLNFSEDLFFFFGDHLIVGGKNVWISDVSETFRLKFRTNRLKLIQGQWKFESTSYAHFSLFQNSPPFFKSWLRAWCLPLNSFSVFCLLVSNTAYDSPMHVLNADGDAPSSDSPFHKFGTFVVETQRPTAKALKKYFNYMKAYTL